jgi:putative transposase
LAHLLKFNKNTVQRIFQLKHWQVRKRPIGFRPRIRAVPSVANALNERGATDLCRVWSGRDGWTVVERVIRTLKDQCVHRHRFETLQAREPRDRRPHQSLRHYIESRFPPSQRTRRRLEVILE